jgi:PAS domain S-box-containing protein
VGVQDFEDDTTDSQHVTRLRAVFEASRNPMLIADDRRRWVTGNAAAGDLLGIPREEIPWRTIDEFTPAGDRGGLEEQWDAFLSAGAAEGWYELEIPDRGSQSIEFSATANVLPARHLSVFIAPDQTAAEKGDDRVSTDATWTPLTAGGSDVTQLTEREREVMTLVASGLQGGEVAERLYLSPETVKSHVNNSMSKLGVHTRAGAVAVALVTGQISWESG